ncbi:MAG: pyridoxamine 5'-phosphate oxidase family protein [Candidatus Omnitrophica bacterium]|jgi:general stress protein 26|nr:pyridoxamine 5'-phosphate oxidase family protein [Candidatus Omnitrophota bacterium]MDD5660593.1 pyridoxamine 5'-phosphate oxidase family protein [Candidatus Omnitrophota bacterium]
MKQLTQEIIDFLYAQGFVIVASIDKNGFPHSSCKAIVKADSEGRIYLVDVYHGVTCENITRNPLVSISAVDEYKFTGYCLKGKASIVPNDDISQEIIKKWEDNITSRIAKRLLANLSRDKIHPHHPEASLPGPKHLIAFKAEQIVNLAPGHLRKEI